MHGHRRRGYALAHPAVAAVEEFVEYAGRTGLGPHVHEADQFGRVYLQVSRLLRDEGETSDQRGVVDLVVNGFPAELNVGRSLCLLAPESVEHREAGILETGDIHPLVELKCCCNRLTHNDIPLTEGKFEEQVLISDVI